MDKFNSIVALGESARNASLSLAEMISLRDNPSASVVLRAGAREEIIILTTKIDRIAARIKEISA